MNASCGDRFDLITVDKFQPSVSSHDDPVEQILRRDLENVLYLAELAPDADTTGTPFSSAEYAIGMPSSVTLSLLPTRTDGASGHAP